MPKVFFSLAVLALVSFGTGSCSHDKMVTNPNAATPVVTNIQPNPSHADSMLIFAGTRFDQTATFDLRQGGMVKATLTNPIFARPAHLRPESRSTPRFPQARRWEATRPA